MSEKKTDNPYKRAADHKRTPPGGQRTPEPPKQPEPVPVTPEPPVQEANPLAGLVVEKPDGKSCGFYLSSEAISKLEKAAKQNKCSKSKVLDTLIRNSL